MNQRFGQPDETEKGSLKRQPGKPLHAQPTRPEPLQAVHQAMSGQFFTLKATILARLET
ncbi:MAG: hypothetical protein ACD_23C00392G0002 [uncultured bacterium]|jgi:hypothetical protein|nr:MAG: hypothetical protein ACD_23C00392G0002 [uncultured bacterium]